MYAADIVRGVVKFRESESAAGGGTSSFPYSRSQRLGLGLLPAFWLHSL